MVYAGFGGGKTAEKEAEKGRILDHGRQFFTEANEGNEERDYQPRNKRNTRKRDQLNCKASLATSSE